MHSQMGKPSHVKSILANNVEYICKTERIGLCSKCLYSHYKEGHQISCIKEIFKNMRVIIEEMENKVINVAKRNQNN